MFLEVWADIEANSEEEAVEEFEAMEDPHFSLG